MDTRHVWTTLFILLGSVVLLSISYLWLGLWGAVPVLLLILLTGALWFYFRSHIVILNELEIGVIFHRRTGNFVRFIDTPYPAARLAGQAAPPAGIITGAARYALAFLHLLRDLLFGSQTPWLQRLFGPYYFWLARDEKLESVLSKRSQTVKDTAENLRTREGIPIRIDWAVSFTIDVNLIMQGIEPKLARGLSAAPDKIVGGRVWQSLKDIIEEMEIHQLYVPTAGAAPQSLYGPLKSLEDALRQEINGRLTNLGFKDIPLKDIKLGPITLPAQVEQALKATHQRKLQTEIMTQSLQDLQTVIRNFTADDMARLNELERLRILDTRSSWVNMADLVVKKDKHVVRAANPAAGTSPAGGTSPRQPSGSGNPGSGSANPAQ